jgi:hypothetical protein
MTPVVASTSWPVIRTWFAGLAQAAFEHVAHAQLAAHLLHVDRAALVGEARVARDHEQPAHARQRRDDVLHHPVDEVVLGGIAAEVEERQDGNGRTVREGEHRHGRLLRPRRIRSVACADLADEPVALARHRAHQALLLAAVADRRAHRVDVTGESGFRDDPPAPYRIDQVVLADDARPVPQQIRQHVEGLRPDRDRFRSAGQLPPIRVEHVFFEDELHEGALPDMRHVSKPHGRPSR